MEIARQKALQEKSGLKDERAPRGAVIVPLPDETGAGAGDAPLKDEKCDSQVLSQRSTEALAQYRKSRVNFGLSRMRLGSYLLLIRENKLWDGIAENWESFLAGENINSYAARQYINVARTFIFDMDLPEDVLGRLAVAGITALEKAGRVINDDNRDEMISVLTSLSEKDAVQRIMELSSGEEPSVNKPSMRMLRMLREFYEMPPDMQMDFLGKVGGRRKSQLENDQRKHTNQ